MKLKPTILPDGKFVNGVDFVLIKESVSARVARQ
jgi:hypothetical protein